MHRTEHFMRQLIEADFDLTFSIYKEKLSYWMVVWSDGTEGTVYGPFAGHGHNCRVAGFTFKGWDYAHTADGWVVLRNGQNDFRQGENPFPAIPENLELTTW